MKTFKRFNKDLDKLNYSDFDYFDYYGTFFEIGFDFDKMTKQEKNSLGEKLSMFNEKYQNIFIEKTEIETSDNYLLFKVFLTKKAIKKIERFENRG